MKHQYGSGCCFYMPASPLALRERERDYNALCAKVCSPRNAHPGGRPHSELLWNTCINAKHACLPKVKGLRMSVHATMSSLGKAQSLHAYDALLRVKHAHLCKATVGLGEAVGHMRVRRDNVQHMAPLGNDISRHVVT